MSCLVCLLINLKYLNIVGDNLILCDNPGLDRSAFIIRHFLKHIALQKHDIYIYQILFQIYIVLTT